MNESKQTLPANLTRVTAAEVFKDAERLEEILSEIETAARSIVPDKSTAKGRKSIASVAAKVARSKTFLDGLGKDLVSGLKQKAGEVDAQRRMLRDRLDALKEEVRRPLTEWEQAEADRQAKHRDGITRIQAAVGGIDAPIPMSSIALAARIADIEAVEINETWEEFQGHAQQAKDATLFRLHQQREQTKTREDAEARAEAERKAREEQERQEREERIAREAEERAKQEAKAETERLERERQEAVQREQEAERRAEEAEARAKQEAEEAARQERERIEAQEQARQEEEQRRAADREHRAQIHRDAAAELCIVADITVEQARGVITAIARGQIPNVSISY